MDTTFPTPDEILRERRALQALARGIVRDADLAEDVVQEAWLRPGPRLGSWLRTVTRNLALNERRARATRERHERAAARPEAQPSIQHELERTELVRALAAAVLELEEPQRTTVILRYFRGWTPARIARATEAPLATVKSRLQRALHALRARLEREGHGHALLIFAAATPWGSVALVAGTLLVLGLGTLAWQRHLAPSAGEAPEVAALPPGAAEARTLAGDSRREPVPAQATASAPAGGEACELVVLVRRREDGTPVADVAIELSGANLPPGPARTDAAGRWSARFAAAPLRSFQTVRAGAGPDTTSAERVLDEILVAGRTTEVVLEVHGGASLAGRVVNQDGAPVPGARVLGWCRTSYDPRRAPEREVRAGPDGSFRVEHLGEAFLVTAEAPGLTCLRGLRGTLAAGAVAGDIGALELVLDEGRAYRGRVVDEAGAALEGARLEVDGTGSSSERDATAWPGVFTFEPCWARATSDAAGRFELANLPRGLGHRARVNRAGFLEQFATLDADADVLVTLERGFDVTGRVLGWDGAPLPGARVRAEGSDASYADDVTDAEGRFRLVALKPRENAYVTVVAPGQALFARQPVRVGPDGDGPLELRLEPPRVLAGRVLDEAGQALAGARVHIQGERIVEAEADHGVVETLEWLLERDETRTDADGRFRFEDLYDGAFELRAARADEPALFAKLQVRSGSEDVEVVLERSRLERLTFSGRVTDARDGAPLPAFDVSVSSLLEGVMQGRAVQVRDADGRFRLAGYEPGVTEVTISAPGYASWASEQRERAEGEERLDVRLFPARTLGLVLRASDGSTHPSPARVTFEDAGGRRLFVQYGPSSGVDTLSVGPRVEFASGLPATLVRVRADLGRLGERTFEVDLTEPREEPLVLGFEPERTGQVDFLLLETAGAAGLSDTRSLEQDLREGRVQPVDTVVALEFLDAHGTYAEVRLTPLSTRTVEGEHELRVFEVVRRTAFSSSTRNEDGPQLSLELPVGRVRVRATAEGYEAFDQQLEVGEGQRSVALALRRTPARR